MTKVKICGCRQVEDALTAAEAGADFVSMIFAESRRKVSVAEASDIVRALGRPLAEREMKEPPALFRSEAKDLRSWFEHGGTALDRLLERKRPLTVGVFANNDPDEINETADECGLDLIQLAGDEPWSNCLLANRQVIRVIHVRDGEDEQAVTSRIEAGSAIAAMLDSGGKSAFGGTGQSFDWHLAAAVGQRLPVWLAGGLTPENVAQAIGMVQPWCVDVSSGVETVGVKDKDKIREFIRVVKGKNNEFA